MVRKWHEIPSKWSISLSHPFRAFTNLLKNVRFPSVTQYNHVYIVLTIYITTNTAPSFNILTVWSCYNTWYHSKHQSEHVIYDITMFRRSWLCGIHRHRAFFQNVTVPSHVLSVSFDRYFSPRIESVRSFTLLFFWLGHGDRQKTRLPSEKNLFFQFKTTNNSLPYHQRWNGFFKIVMFILRF